MQVGDVICMTRYSFSDSTPEVTDKEFGIVERIHWLHDNPHNLIGIKFFDNTRGRDYRYECYPTNTKHLSFKVVANNATKVVR